MEYDRQLFYDYFTRFMGYQFPFHTEPEPGEKEPIGEHSISIGSLRAFREQFPTLSVLQVRCAYGFKTDCHGTPYSHACALYESAQRFPLVQVGIRSMEDYGY